MRLSDMTFFCIDRLNRNRIRIFLGRDLEYNISEFKPEDIFTSREEAEKALED